MIKESIFDVLMYLFEHYIDDEPQKEPDRGELEDHLIEVGFGNSEVTRAFDWLEALSRLRTPDTVSSKDLSFRAYRPEEVAQLGAQGIGFLQYLEQNDVLNATTREQIIERAQALDSQPIDIEQLKWVVLMVLFNQPDDSPADIAWLEDLVYDNQGATLH
ncbi:MAG: DUF494 family protein [Thiotrichales bacterium]